jgi:tRNA dimethylallyltransferase
VAANNLPFAIMLMGPTAAGKTRYALELVKRLPVDIISVDSALVYRGMDIGTAKPDAETLRLAPHRLIDIRDPADPYSAADFSADALREMKAIIQTRRIPLLVGGTMLYFRALEQGLSELPAADPDIRQQLEHETQKFGLETLHQRLAAIDPVAALRIHPNDPQRIQRALEVYEITGSTLTEHYEKCPLKKAPYRFLKVVLSPPDRGVLHERIGQRFTDMLSQGFLGEVNKLYQRKDLHAELPAIRAVGYRQAWAHLDGRLGAEEWVERAVIATRQYAKRQLTWLRSETDTHWLDPDQNQSLDKLLNLVNLDAQL